MLFLVMAMVLLHVHVSIPDTPWSIRHAGPDDRDVGPKETPDLAWEWEAPSIAAAAYELYGRGGDLDNDKSSQITGKRTGDLSNATTVRLALEASKAAELIPWSRVNISGRMVGYKVHPASIEPARTAVRHSGATPAGVLSGSLAGRNQVRASWGWSE